MTRARARTRPGRLPPLDLPAARPAPVEPAATRVRGRGDRIAVGAFLVFWLAFGLMPVAFSAGDLRLTAGAAGTPGTLSVTRCVTDHTGSRRTSTTDCDGWFVPARGGPSVPVHTTADGREGDVGPAQLEPDGTRAVPADPTAVVAALTVPFLGLALLAFWPLALLAALGRGGDRRRWWTVGKVASAVGAVGVVVGLVASLS